MAVAVISYNVFHVTKREMTKQMKSVCPAQNTTCSLPAIEAPTFTRVQQKQEVFNEPLQRFSKLLHLWISQQQYRLTTDDYTTTDLSALCYSHASMRNANTTCLTSQVNLVIKDFSYI